MHPLAPIRAAACALALLAGPPSFAQAADPAMNAALERLVDSQHLERNWPIIRQNSASAGTRKVLQGASDALDANPSLSPAQRTRAKAAIDKLAPQIAADVDAMHAGIDARQLMRDMVEAVYPKYYSLAEIQEMTRFYESSAFAKMTAISLQAKDEIERTGANPALVWARYEARLTPEDKQQLGAFQDSATGKKTQRLGPQISQDSLRYLQGRTDAMLDAVVARYQDRIAAAAR